MQPAIVNEFWEEEVNRLLESAESYGTKVRILTKTGEIADYEKWWERAAIRFVSLFNKTVLSGYIQTFVSDGEVRIYWNGQFQPDNLHDYALLRHELTHGIVQAEKFGKGLFGILVFYFLYVLVLPTVFTCRALFEKQAYEESIRTYLGAGRYDLVRQNLIGYRSNFVGLSYLWMDPIWGGGFGKGKGVSKRINNGKITPQNTPLQKIGFQPRRPDNIPSTPMF